jgi:hypothetical protein
MNVCYIPTEFKVAFGQNEMLLRQVKTAFGESKAKQ